MWIQLLVVHQTTVRDREAMQIAYKLSADKKKVAHELSETLRKNMIDYI